MEIVLILWLFCGVICYFIIKSKGYPNNICLLHGVFGAFFGIFEIIFVLFKKPYDTQTAKNQERKSAIEQLGELAELKELGVISEHEYESRKHDLLTKI